MAWFSRRRARRTARPVLQVERLDVHYGRAHALQEVSLTLDHGVIAAAPLLPVQSCMRDTGNMCASDRTNGGWPTTASIK